MVAILALATVAIVAIAPPKDKQGDVSETITSSTSTTVSAPTTTDTTTTSTNPTELESVTTTNITTSEKATTNQTTTTAKSTATTEKATTSRTTTTAKPTTTTKKPTTTTKKTTTTAKTTTQKTTTTTKKVTTTTKTTTDAYEGRFISGTLNNKRYEVYNVCMPYRTAEMYAQRKGGRLAMIKSQEEQDFIVSLFFDATFQKPLGSVPTGYYLGAKKDSSTGKWLWNDGTDIMSSYNNFIQNDELGDSYLIIYSASERANMAGVGLWDDARSPTELSDWAFIIEYDI